jgi:hypothetical protein
MAIPMITARINSACRMLTASGQEMGSAMRDWKGDHSEKDRPVGMPGPPTFAHSLG